MNAARAAGAKKYCALGLDLGTSSAKAVVTDIEGKVLAQASAGYAVTSAVSGYAESDPGDWWSAVRACACEAVQAAVSAGGARPSAIGLSGQMHGLVLTSADVMTSPCICPESPIATGWPPDRPTASRTQLVTAAHHNSGSLSA